MVTGGDAWMLFVGVGTNAWMFSVQKGQHAFRVMGDHTPMF